ncbi:TonB-dependent receptor [Saprospira grandis]|uniref:TonB-dependent receptor n=1 Tax=Saprospira grandis (strain Lewin) TaxID=984262 RepID=H6L6S0_SAPGL|nr:TonB-dependent receptor [Saprospira grandis]AFC25316.1 TonB-dependent receptor [Saprospira grandis str. Lewin]
MRNLYILLCFWPIFLWGQDYQIHGEVYDYERHELVLGQPVLLLPDSLGQLTDFEGHFHFELSGELGDSIELQAFGPQGGFVSKRFVLGLEKDIHLHLYLAADANCLRCQEVDVVLVQEQDLGSKPQPSQELLNAEDIQKNLAGNLAQSLAEIPGVSALSVGVGIAKPIIRGQMGNRVQLLEGNLAQEGQQWGNDHGLAIDALSVGRMELSKGAGSLRYGSDALGGSIRLLPTKVAPHNSWQGQVLLLGKSNNEHLGLNLQLGRNWHNYFWQFQYSEQRYGDYRVPADEFVYQGFVLPLYEERLKNTAGQERSGKIVLGKLWKKGGLRWTNSLYQMKGGLFSGAMGVPRAYELQPDGNWRDIDFPSQAIRHFKSFLNFNYQLSKQKALYIDLGWQQNLREEFAFPHLHNRPADANDRLALALNLSTFSGRLELRQNYKAWALAYGISGQSQSNKRGGFDFLIPAFEQQKLGAFALSHWVNKEERLGLDFGLRLDYQQLQSTAFAQSFDVDGQNISLGAWALERQFWGSSASVGLWKKLNAWSNIQAQLSKSFRPPHPVELLSDGVHHGSFRHEKGDSSLGPESGYQFDASWSWRKGNFGLLAEAYAHYFDGYLYLSPAPRFSPLPDAGQLYEYEQQDALFSGLELRYDYRYKGFKWKQSLEYLYSYGLETALPLPFSPPLSVRSQLAWSKDWVPKKGLKTVEIALGHRYWAAQNQVARNEKSTPAASLWDLRLDLDFVWGKQPLSVRFLAQNLFNTPYLAHLSRYRQLELPEQGRNIQLQLRLPIIIRD